MFVKIPASLKSADVTTVLKIVFKNRSSIRKDNFRPVVLPAALNSFEKEMSKHLFEYGGRNTFKVLVWFLQRFEKRKMLHINGKMTLIK